MIIAYYYYVHIPTELMFIALVLITQAMPGYHKDAHTCSKQGKSYRLPVPIYYT